MRLLLLMCLSPALFAGDWPQWRGPARNGVANFTEPKAWTEKLKLRWKVQVGEGHSSPVSTGGKVFLLTRQGDNEAVTAVDPETGKTVWQQTYPAPYSVNFAAFQHGKGPKSTPVVAAGRLYTLGINGILSCFDAATGKPLWRHTFSGQYPKTSPSFGTAMSPVVDRGLLIAHVGGDSRGALTAFDAATGTTKWTWTGDGPAYASPILVELGGVRQVITQTQKNIVSVAAANGELLWKLPFTTSYEQNSVTPIQHGQNIIFSGLANGVFAVKISRGANGWMAEELWRNRGVSMYMNSPVIDGEYLYGFSHINKGQFFCLDLRTGSTVWTTKGREAENAALVSAGSVLLALTDGAELIVIRRSEKGFTAVRRYTVADGATWAHPLLLDHAILIKDVKTLARWDID